jgi:hypothetical protein
VFQYLNDDALRRRREFELLEATLRSPSNSMNLISQNSVKILYKRLMRDFDTSLNNIAHVYHIGTDNSFVLTEEQFVAFLYTLGLFRDIGQAEENLYEDILLILCQ